MTKQLSYRSVLALLMLMALLPSRSARADEVHAMSAVLASGPYYPPNRWLPVRVMTTNRSSEAVAGDIEFPFRGSNEQVMFRLPITVPPKSSIITIAHLYVPVIAEATDIQPKKGKPVSLLDKDPICTVVWRSKAGAMLARCPVLAQALPEDSEGTFGRIPLDRSMLMAITAETPPGIEPLADTLSDAPAFASLFQSTQGTRLVTQMFDVAEAPRDALGFDAVGLVLLEPAAVGSMDSAQRESLLQYLSSGGIVVISTGAEMIDLSGSWLAPYLPARYVGSRYASAIQVASDGKTQSLPLSVPLDIAEWVADPTMPDANVIAADQHYVHLAYRPIGLGRLVLSSFPLTSLDIKSPAVKQLWTSAMPASPGMKWETSRLNQNQSEFLESMVGAKVPPWIVAAGVVMTYVVIVLLIQLLARQGRRPMGFVAIVGLSIVMAAGLIVAASFRDQAVPLSMARIDLLDLSTGGMRTEVVSLLGPNGTSFPLSVSPGVGLRQSPSGDTKAMDMYVSPLRVERAEVSAQRVDRIWQISTAAPAGLSMQVKGTFTAGGLSLSVDNQAGVIEKPVIIGTQGKVSLANLPAGKSDVIAGAASAAVSAIKLEEEQLRDRILEASITKPLTERIASIARGDNTIYLAGWMANPPAPLLELPPGKQPTVTRSNALLRTPVQIDPSPVGTAVRVDSAFTQFVSGDVISMPYDFTTQQWIDTYTPRDFLVGVSVPPGMGHLSTKRVTITLRADAPQQTITLFRGQAIGGKVKPNFTGPQIAQWAQLIGSRTVSLDVTDGDVDANGWLWIGVSVESPATQSRWKIQEFSADYEGIIDGPPRPAVLPVREYEPPPPPAPPKSAQPKKPGNKPANKPATKPAAPKKKGSQPK